MRMWKISAAWDDTILHQPPQPAPEIPNVPAPQPEIPEPAQPGPELPEPLPDPGIPPSPPGPEINPDSSPTIPPPER